MKKFLTILAASSAILMSLSSCQAVLDTITNSPIFFVPETMYDGQEFQITRLSTCKYKWYVNSDCFTIKEITIGNDPHIAIGTADLTPNAGKYKVVTITAVNPDKADESPVEKEVRVMPWSLVVCDMSGNSISNPNTLQAGTKYQIRAEGSPEYLRGGLLKDKGEYHELEWTATMGTLSAPKLKDGETDHTMAKTFECTHSGQVTITAKLCKKTVSRTLNVVDAAAI